MRKYYLPAFFIIVITTISFIILYWSYRYTYPYNKTVPKAKKGLIDFSLSDLEKIKCVKLAGECEFYWNQLLYPNDFRLPHKPQPHLYFDLPGVWNNYQIDGIKLPSFGFATYRLLIKIKDRGAYGIKFKEFDCSYKVWINGKLMAQVGKVGTGPESSYPNWKRAEIYFEPQSDTIEMVMQISNFVHRKGGPEDIIYFGKADQIREYKNFQVGISYFLLGVLFIVALYHFVLFVFRPNNKSVLFFSVFCWLILFRLLTTGEKLFTDIFPSVSFITSVRIEYLSYTLSMPVFVSFISFFFSRKIPKYWHYISYGISIITSIIILFFPIKIFSYTPLFYQFFAFFYTIFVLINLIIDMVRRTQFAFILFGGFFFMILIIVNDMLYYNHLVGTSQLLPIGLFIMIVSQAFVLSRISSLSFNQVEQLSRELDIKNRELEVQVIDRTREILQKKNEIEKQKATLQIQADNLKNINNKLLQLDRFKEDMTSMLVHDLKNPLNVILNLSKNNLVLYAGHQMLTLIQNILDVQKYQDSQMTIHLSNQNINKLIESAYKQVSFLAEKKAVSFKNNIDMVLEFQLDPELTERIFVNLFTNAIKHSPVEGEIQLNYKLTAGKLRFSISDNGSGIPKNKQEVLFSRYGQIDTRKSGLIGSTGLGLAFCKLAVEAHCGTIGYLPNKPKGSIFWIELPARDGLYKGEPQIDVNPGSQDELIKMLMNNFKDADYRYLESFAQKISNFQIFEISGINSELKKIDESFSANVKLWKQYMQKATTNINQNQFENLVKSIANH
jgi:signal transduction histidine kinase